MRPDTHAGTERLHRCLAFAAQMPFSTLFPLKPKRKGVSVKPTPRMDRHETIVTGRCETFRYCHIGGKRMTSAELKHRAKLQEWAARIQDCRSSGLSVRAWCRQEEINAATYYRWERELLALAETEPCSSVLAVRFAELPAPKQVSRNVAERSATLHIGNASLDIYPGCDTEQLKMLVELLRLC